MATVGVKGLKHCQLATQGLYASSTGSVRNCSFYDVFKHSPSRQNEHGIGLPGLPDMQVQLFAALSCDDFTTYSHDSNLTFVV